MHSNTDGLYLYRIDFWMQWCIIKSSRIGDITVTYSCPMMFTYFPLFLKPYYFSTQTDDNIIKRSHDLYSTYLDDINCNFPQKMVCYV